MAMYPLRRSISTVDSFRFLSPEITKTIIWSRSLHSTNIIGDIVRWWNLYEYSQVSRADTPYSFIEYDNNMYKVVVDKDMKIRYIDNLPEMDAN